MLTDCGWPSPTGTSSQPTRKIIARKVTAALPITCAALGLMVLAACGGSDSQPQTPSPEQIERLSSRLAVMTLVVAVAREGRGAFDNFLPCVRRGVINYYNTEAGRHATFSNCDLGDGVSVHGDGELKWVWPELSMNRRTISRIMWAGSLTAVVDDNTEVQINELEIDALEMEIDFKRDLPGRLQLGSLTVRSLGETVRVEDNTMPSKLFDTSAMDIDSIPNHANSLAALTESDMKRLAYNEVAPWILFLINEGLESQRGNHTHEGPCSTSVVTQNLEAGTTRIGNTLRDCNFTGSGLFMDGTFSLEGVFLDESVSIIIEGDLTIGGGVPKTTIRKLEWSIENLDSSLTGPGRSLISGKIYGETDDRPFSFELIVDD